MFVALPFVIGIVWLAMVTLLGTIQDVSENGFGGGASNYSAWWVHPGALLFTVAVFGGVLAFVLVRDRKRADGFRK